MSKSKNSYWEEKLEPNEKLLWTGTATETGLFDPVNKKSTLYPFLGAAAWLCITLIFFSSKTDGPVAAILLELPVLFLVGIPFLNAFDIRRFRYAITDKRIITRIGSADYSMEYDHHTPVEKRENNTVCIGEAVEIKPEKERFYLLYHGTQDEDNNVTGVVLYTTTDPSGAIKALSS